jgi:hypothetical protein
MRQIDEVVGHPAHGTGHDDNIVSRLANFTDAFRRPPDMAWRC